jgi:hypothetical protein
MDRSGIFHWATDLICIVFGSSGSTGVLVFLEYLITPVGHRCFHNVTWFPRFMACFGAV